MDNPEIFTPLTDAEGNTLNAIVAASMLDRTICLMRVELDGEPRAVVCLVKPDENGVGDDAEFFPVALLLRDEDLELLNPGAEIETRHHIASTPS